MLGATARRGLAVSSVVGLLGVLAPHAAAACADADAQPADLGAARATLAVDCLTNEYRASVGLPALTTDPRLAQAAQDHATDMSTRGFYAHTTPDGVAFSTRITRAGYAWDAAGENIAHQSTTPREVLAAWVASPAHRENLESATYTQGGYGVTTGADGTFWVQEFALPTPPAPAAAPTSAPAATTATGDVDPAGYDLATAARTLRARASASRAGRTLRLRVTVPGQRASRARITILVSQRGRVVRRLTSVGATGRSHRLRTRLPKALAGRAVVRIGTATAVARFG